MDCNLLKTPVKLFGLEVFTLISESAFIATELDNNMLCVLSYGSSEGEQLVV